MMGVILLISARMSEADTYAWLTDFKTKGYKLDVQNNKIIQSLDIGSMSGLDWKRFAVDQAKGLLYAVYDMSARGSGQGVRVINLNDFTIKKDLNIRSLDPNNSFPKIILPPAGDKFYVVWWDKRKEVNGEGGETIASYDSTTLNKLQDDVSIQIDYNLETISSVNKEKLYAIDLDNNEIKHYDKSLKLIKSVHIDNIWNTPTYLKRIDYKSNNGKLLFMENTKSSAMMPNNVKYFVFDVETNTMSIKMMLTEKGEKILSADGAKLVVNEITGKKNDAGFTETWSVNKIHIYDTSTGQKLKSLDLSVNYTGSELAVTSPDSTKLYVYANKIATGVNNIVIINLLDYTVLAEIPLEAQIIEFFHK